MQRIIERQNKVVITDRMWARLLSSTNQPSFLGPKETTDLKKEESSLTGLLDEGATSEEGNSGNIDTSTSTRSFQQYCNWSSAPLRRVILA